jgi:hypothetical protein
MPLGRPPLAETKRALLRTWIEMGAQR